MIWIILEIAVPIVAAVSMIIGHRREIRKLNMLGSLHGVARWEGEGNRDYEARILNRYQITGRSRW